jgi:TPR repeat protein
MRAVAVVIVVAGTVLCGAANAQTDAASLTDTANAYFTGKGVAQDDARAAALYQEAADMGDARAMHNLGFMYAEGRGVPQDEFKAIDLYRAAMAQSYVPAITSLGVAYAEGRGVSREPATAKTLLEKAAAAGDKRAKDYLARAKWTP